MNQAAGSAKRDLSLNGFTTHFKVAMAMPLEVGCGRGSY